MGALVVIPARGGSKGLPRKNVAAIGGRSLVARAVDAARAARHAGRVVVSTDDPEIAAVAVAAGAEVVERPAAISGDSASSEAAVLHALDAVERRAGTCPEIVVMVQCTSPFITAGDIDGVIGKILLEGFDSAFTAVPFHHFVWQASADGTAEGVNHDGGPRKRRQDLTPQYLENGAAYAMRAGLFRDAGLRFCGRTGIHVGDPARLLEIDDAQDLAKARAFASVLDDPGPALPAEISAIIFDFDGVLTDNKVYVDQDGREAVACTRADGIGLSRLRRLGVPLLVLSTERNPVVTARCRKLEMECLQGIDDKWPALLAWARDRGIDPGRLVYVGNDINDRDCLANAHFAVGPADAMAEIVPLLRLRTRAAGGRGAVRELCDLLHDGLTGGRVRLVSAAGQPAFR